MNGIKSKVYADTNPLRYFSTAFQSGEIDPDLRSHLVMSPISIMELLAQLASGGANDALTAIKTIVRVHGTPHIALLPWSDEVFRSIIFKLPLSADTLTESIQYAVQVCVDAPNADVLKQDSIHFRDILDLAKDAATANFSRLLGSWRAEGPLPDEERRRIFAVSIAGRVGVPPEDTNAEEIIGHLSALFTYEVEKLKLAASDRNYRPENHSNDALDAEQLVYLAEPTLHFLTSDRGFKRAETSSQTSRLHIVSADALLTPEQASATIREILVTAG